MENMDVFCRKCDREVNHEVLEIKEGENCWLVIKVKCSECGEVQDVALYS